MEQNWQVYSHVYMGYTHQTLGFIVEGSVQVYMQITSCLGIAYKKSPEEPETSHIQN